MVNIFNKFIIIAAVVASAIFAGALFIGGEGIFMPDNRINGINLVATRQALASDELKEVSRINANWIAVVPYAFSRKNEPRVHFDVPRQWYGETPEGIANSIVMAKDVGYKVMIKPHVWVIGDGWPGDYTLSNDSAWQVWERDYTAYLMTYARMADSLKVEMLCVGTEYRHLTRQKPEYWRKLIGEIRNVFQGELTYAANWDNYENIQFWDVLDYIGIDAYFPLSKNKRPEVEELIVGWQPEKERLFNLGQQYDKPILFTEYGYQSVEYGTMGHWEADNTGNVDMVLQKSAYEALYKSFWMEPWFAGGFLWKWFPDHQSAGGINDKRFTPQNKHAQEVIEDWYGK